jgi:putative endonuclease
VSEDPRRRLAQASRHAEDPRRTLGRRGEHLAAEHLGRRGFEILERNYRTRFGELDIVAFDGRTIAFCEVKTRRVNGSGTALPPLASLHRRKQLQVRKMALQWLAERDDRRYAAVLRFDAIGVWLDAGGRLVQLEHLEGAF